MNFYFFFCILLNFASRGLAGYINELNEESTLNSTENLFMATTESNLNLTKNMTTISTIQSNCGKNMVSVATNPPDDGWICLCYHPFVLLAENQCSELFRQGSCEPGNFLVRPPYNSPNPETFRCVPNPCLEDGLIPENGTCRNITNIPLCRVGQLFYIEETMKIECKNNPTLNLFSWPSIGGCPSDSRKDKHGVCRKKL